MAKKKKKKMHPANPNFCMIQPNPDEDIPSSGQS